jgi:hypothetical protein
MTEMLVICPSRARPHNIAALLQAWHDTNTVATLAVCLDEQDPQLDEYLAILDPWPTDRVIVFRSEWRTLCAWVNFVAVTCRGAAGFDIVGQIGDDHHPRTPGWDNAIQFAMQPLGVVYCNDLHQGEKLPTAAFVDAEVVRRLGYMVPPTITHLYMDNFFRSLGEGLGTLTYLPDVVIEHMHPHAGKAEMDDGYRQVNSTDAYRQGLAAYRTYCRRHLADDLARLA